MSVELNIQSKTEMSTIAEPIFEGILEEKLSVRSVRISSGFANEIKIEKFHQTDAFVLKLKNKMSAYIHNNIQLLMDGKEEFIRNYNKFNNSEFLMAWETQTLFHDIVGFYKNRIDQLRGTIDTSIQIGYKKTLYKKGVTLKNGIQKKKGDIKDFTIKKKYSELGKMVKLLAFLDTDNLEQYKEAKFYEAILFFQKSKHWSRIIALSKTINKRLFSKIKVIEFQTGTYRVNLKGDEFIIDETNAKFQHWFRYKGMFFPLQINKKYHKDLSKIKFDKNKQVSVKVVKNRVDFIFTRDYKPEFKQFKKVSGIDINIKHNFMTTSEGYLIDYDRKYITEFIAAIKEIDKIGYQNINEEQKKKLKKLIAQNEFYFKKLVSEALDYFENEGYTDLVMEDLTTKDFRSSFVSSAEFGERYTRLIRLLRLGNIKKWMIEQGENRGIRVHITPAPYTSQECTECHFIDHNNRPTQEEFKCISCGFEGEADFVSPKNILTRFTSNVLSEKLHTKDDYGRLLPRKFGREKLKEILSSFYDSPAKVKSNEIHLFCEIKSNEMNKLDTK